MITLAEKVRCEKLRRRFFSMSDDERDAAYKFLMDLARRPQEPRELSPQEQMIAAERKRRFDLLSEDEIERRYNAMLGSRATATCSLEQV